MKPIFIELTIGPVHGNIPDITVGSADGQSQTRFLDANNILSLERIHNYTCVEFENHLLKARETPQEILKKIAAAQKEQ